MRVDIGDVLEGVFKSDRYKNMWLVWRYKTESKTPLGIIETNFVDSIVFFVIDGFYTVASWLNSVLFKRELKKVQLDPWDIAHLEISLASIIVPALKELKLRNLIVIEDIDPSDVPEGYAGDKTTYLLDEMIYAFSQTSENKKNYYYGADYVIDFDRVMRGRILFAKYFDELWDF